jgi:hypothetical protein
VKDEEHIGGLQVPVHVARGMKHREQSKHLTGHSQHRRGEAILLQPVPQSDAAVEGHEGRKAVSIAADDLPLGIVVSKQKARQTLAEGLVVVEALLQPKVFFLQKEPVPNNEMGSQWMPMMLSQSVWRGVKLCSKKMPCKILYCPAFQQLAENVKPKQISLRRSQQVQGFLTVPRKGAAHTVTHNVCQLSRPHSFGLLIFVAEADKAGDKAGQNEPNFMFVHVPQMSCCIARSAILLVA